MKQFFVVLLVVSALSSSCIPSASGGYTSISAMQQDADLMLEKARIQNEYLGNPDTDDWYSARADMAKAIGDRTFAFPYDRTFDSLALAISSLGLTVENMERDSGYIVAKGITLPPSESRSISRQAFEEWSKTKGYAATVMNRRYRTSTYQTMSGTIDSQNQAWGQFQKRERALNFQVTKSGEEETIVKLRFTNVYYPQEVERYYEMVWEAVDKQLFVDDAIEGDVAPR